MRSHGGQWCLTCHVFVPDDLDDDTHEVHEVVTWQQLDLEDA